MYSKKLKSNKTRHLGYTDVLERKKKKENEKDERATKDDNLLVGLENDKDLFDKCIFTKDDIKHRLFLDDLMLQVTTLKGQFVLKDTS